MAAWARGGRAGCCSRGFAEAVALVEFHLNLISFRRNTGASPQRVSICWVTL